MTRCNGSLSSMQLTPSAWQLCNTEERCCCMAALLTSVTHLNGRVLLGVGFDGARGQLGQLGLGRSASSDTSSTLRNR